MNRSLKSHVCRATGQFAIGLVTISTVLLLSSCRDGVSPDARDLQGPALSETSGPVFSVSPSGGDDTENIRDAIAQAHAAGPGSTVYLEPGEFQTGILIFEDFVGTFKGAGRDRTIVKSRPNLDFGSGPFYVDFPTYENPWPALVSVVGGDITISNMTFLIEEESPALPYDYLNYDIIDAIAHILTVTGDEADSRIERIRFEASEGHFFGWSNVVTGLYLQGPLAASDPFVASGEHIVSDCSFHHTPVAIGTVVGNAQVTIGGSASGGNIIEDALMGIVINDARDSDFVVSHNHVNAHWYAVRVYQGYFREQHQDDLPGFPLGHDMRAQIAHNTIDATGRFSTGVWLRDYGLFETETPQLQAVVEKNEITLDTYFFGGILGSGTQGVLVRDNRIRGTGLAGILLGLPSAPDSEWLVLGNNVNEVNAWNAPILLDTYSSHVTVVGGPNKANVLNLGTDNTLTGVNIIEGNAPGPEIHEAMRHMVELMKSMP